MSSTIDFNLKSICSQRNKRLLFTIPPTRYNPPNIYQENPQITKFQLDMRRKAEILMHYPSAKSTQTNNITQKQKWSQIVNTSNKNSKYNDIVLNQYDASGDFFYDLVVKYPNTFTSQDILYRIYNNGNPIYRTIYTIISKNADDCNIDSIEKPTSSSDVPGKIINLVKDPNIPLYNYTKNNNAYGFINTEKINKWDTFISKNVVLYNKINSTLFSLNINSSIDDYAYNFDFNIPINIFFMGKSNNSLSTNDQMINHSIEIKNIYVNIYYNNNSVALIKPILINPNKFPKIVFNIPLTNSEPSKDIYGELYMGMISISNIYLYTQPGYVYDIKIIVDINVPINNNNYNSYYNTLTTGLICNTLNTNKIENNCSIVNNISSDINTGFVFNGS